MYSPKDYKDWQAVAAEQLAEVTPFAVDGPCEVIVRNRVTRPKTTKLIAPKPDVDNYAKGVLDAITKDGRFWDDDSQVVDLTVSKRWTTGEPHIEVIIIQLNETDL